MATTYLPTNDAQLVLWMDNFNKQFADHAQLLGYSATEVADINDKTHQLDLAYAAHLSQSDSARAATQTKDQKRKSALDKARATVRNLQANPKMTDALRALFGITIPDSTSAGGSAAVEANRPLATVDIANPLQHTVKFVDEGTPRSRAKPAGALGAEIWMKIGTEPPVGPAEMSLVAMPTRTRFTHQFAGTEAGKTAWYRLRWVSTRGVKGPWSQVVSATIAA